MRRRRGEIPPAGEVLKALPKPERPGRQRLPEPRPRARRQRLPPPRTPWPLTSPVRPSGIASAVRSTLKASSRRSNEQCSSRAPPSGCPPSSTPLRPVSAHGARPDIAASWLSFSRWDVDACPVTGGAGTHVRAQIPRLPVTGPRRATAGTTMGACSGCDLPSHRTRAPLPGSLMLAAAGWSPGGCRPGGTRRTT